MTNTCIVSAVVPTFNGSQYIVETLDSICAQTRPVDEIIVSDDMSTDNTPERVANYAKSSKIPIRLVVGKRKGISKNYLNGAIASKGDIIFFGDHDDIWLPDRVKNSVEPFLSNEAVMLVCSDSKYVKSDLAPLPSTLRGGKARSKKLSLLTQKDPLKQFIKGLQFDAHTLAFRRSVLNSITQPQFTKHTDLWIDNKLVLATLALGQFEYIPEALTLYRQHETQHTKLNNSPASPAKPMNRVKEIEFLIELLKLNDNDTSMLDGRSRAMRIATLEGYQQLLIDRSKLGPDFASARTLLSNVSNFRYTRFLRRGWLSLAKDVLKVLGAR